MQLPTSPVSSGAGFIAARPPYRRSTFNRTGNREQLSLLDTSERAAQRERDHKLRAALDELNGKMGKMHLVPCQNAAWHLSCAHRTPRWTTQ
ncbi:DUF4113 domain-containing protein [Chromohalobacter israelensis]|uniref:DUF4113 domain-containing protein n=1 Tax=Chromohalobacter israelensis TaxID=141390 RepID=UPI003AF659B6